MEDEISIGCADLRGNRWSAECPPANSGWRRRIQKSCNQSPACHGGVGHDLVQHAGLDGENGGQGRVHDAFRITGHSVHIDSIAAMPLQPDVDIGLVGIPSGHNIEDSTLGRDYREYTAVGCHQTGQCFTGTIVCKEADRFQFRSFLQLFLKLLQFQFKFSIFCPFQFLLNTGDLSFQRFPLLPILTNFGTTGLIVFMLVFVEILGHIPHDAGFSLTGGRNYNGIKAQRLIITRCAFQPVFSLQADCQNAKADHSRHIRRRLAMLRNCTDISSNGVRECIHREGR